MSDSADQAPFHISGVVPSLAVKADMMPVRTETGIGALMPWANRLWMVTYPSSKAGGGYRHHEFPEGFSAHWVRVVADTDCEATAHFTYT